MVVRYDADDHKNDGSTSAFVRKSGGLVSQRVEMYETPSNHDTRKPYSNQQPQSHTTQQNEQLQQLQQQQQQYQIQQQLYQQQQLQQHDGFSRPQIDIEETREDAPSISSGSKQKLRATRDYAGSNLIQTGVNYYSEGNYDKALKAFISALKTQRVSVGDEDICIALTLGNLGSVYLQQDNIDEAERVLTESLEMKRRLAPEMLVADTLNNLGNCANLKGDYEKSMDYYKQALEEIKKKGGGKGDEVNALFNIGRLEIQRRNWNEAMNSLNQACRLAREHYGTNHAFVAQTLDLMGFVQLSTSNMDSAMVSFTGALAIYRRIHGPMHLDVANSLFNVGMVREAKNDLPDAWEAYTTSRDLFARLGTDPDHPGFVTVRRSIANVEKTIAKQNRQKLISKHQKATKQGSSAAAAAPKSFAL